MRIYSPLVLISFPKCQQKKTLGYLLLNLDFTDLEIKVTKLMKINYNCIYVFDNFTNSDKVSIKLGQTNLYVMRFSSKITQCDSAYKT